MNKRVQFLLGLVTVCLAASPAFAVTAGTPDGSGHPYVGYALATLGDQCTGAEFVGLTVLMVDSDTVITLGDAVAAFRDATAANPDIHAFVSFDLTDPYACDPTNTFLRSAVPIIGYAVHPDLNENQSGSVPHENIGVMFLDVSSPPPGLTLPTQFGLIPAENALDFIATTEPRVAVGYGPTRIEQQGNGAGFGQPRVNIFDIPRRFAAVEQVALPPDAQLAAIDRSQDDDACFGNFDAGDIVLLGATRGAQSILATHSACTPGAWGQRLDTPGVRQFLASQGVPVPGS